MIRYCLTFLLLILGGCASVVTSQGVQVSDYVYKIGTGDKLSIKVYGEEALSRDYAVSSNGMIAFPLVGDVPASGKTLTEFRDELGGRLGSQYLRNPQVTVEIVNFRPVFILGEVSRPGEFGYSERMSVFALVAKAGGFTYRANQGYVFIRHESETGERAIKLSSATAVQPGDTVRIPERIF